MPLKMEYSPAEYIGELDRQTEMARALVEGRNEKALNWQPKAGKGWSILQCVDHLLIMNRGYEKALRETVEENRDQLEPRKMPIRPSGWFMRWFIGSEEPPPKFKLPAPSKLQPTSQLDRAIVDQFCDVQAQLTEFVREWGEADLGNLKVRNPIAPLHLTADTMLLLMSYHNRRHLWQAANVTKAEGFPG